MSDEARRRKARRAATDGPHEVQRALGAPMLPSVWGEVNDAKLNALGMLGAPAISIWWEAIGNYLSGRLKTVLVGSEVRLRDTDLPVEWRVTYL